MIKILLWILKHKKITQEDRGLILNYLMASINTIPIQDVITYDLQGTIKINGKSLTPEQMTSIQEGASSLLNNSAYRVIKDQVAFAAVKMGIHRSITTDMLLLSKAALWLNEEEKKLIQTLSGEREEIV